MNVVKICDAIMGSGKTSAAINYMIEHPDERFLFITPYNDECDRLVSAAAAIRMRQPIDSMRRGGSKTKTEDLIRLLKKRSNIVCTHSLFTKYTDETLDAIRNGNYHLIIDECLDTIQDTKISPNDFNHMKKDGWVHEVDGGYTIELEDPFDAKRWDDILRLQKNGVLIPHGFKGLQDGTTTEKYDPKAKYALFWTMNMEVFESFQSITILTYMSEHQFISYYFQINNVQVEYIGVSKYGDKYHFCPYEDRYIPEYTLNLSSKIHICEDPVLNSVGDDPNAFSRAWYTRGNNGWVANSKMELWYLKRMVDVGGVDTRLCGTYADHTKRFRCKGYKTACVAFNARATNQYADRYILGYLVNIFMSPSLKNYLWSNGIAVDQESYATAMMVQWIWRSAIRNGGDIWIYVPSSRMRKLLYQWIADVELQYRERYGMTQEEVA